MNTRILVIEDNPANMELVRYVLEAFGYGVIKAVDGETGVALACTEKPDLVVCDLQLPGIDGIEVARQLRALTAFAHVPLIAVTAYAMVGDRERVLSAGFDGYIAKPLDPQTFVPQIAAFLKSAPPTPPHLDMSTVTPAPQNPAVRACALVLDDTPANTQWLRSLLEPHGINVEATNGIDEALASLRRHIPDLIISDLHLARERGQDFFAAVKARAELKGVPFVFISSTVLQDKDRLDALNAGADRFIVRPIDNASLLAQIESCLVLQRQA